MDLQIRSNPKTPDDAPAPDPAEVLIVGPGAKFLSGIGYHTASIARSFEKRGDPVSVLLIRDLCPQRMYPGRTRIGQHVTAVLRLDNVEHHEGLDWWWGPSLRASLRFIDRRRPAVVLLQWWTAVTAHNYLLVARRARQLGAKVVLEVHESSDVGEAALPLVRRYTQAMIGRLSRSLDGVVYHSGHDAEVMGQLYPSLASLPSTVVYPGPLEHGDESKVGHEVPVSESRQRDAGDPLRFLYFGVLRPYKGIDELAAAHEALINQGYNIHLTVAGEVWDGAEEAIARIRATASAAGIVEGYVPDEKVNALFRDSDVVVLPYRRASASGPVNLAMESGLPLVTTSIPALREACSAYGGVEFAEPGDAGSLADAMVRAMERVGQRYANPQSWDTNASIYRAFFDRLGSPEAGA